MKNLIIILVLLTFSLSLLGTKPALEKAKKLTNEKEYDAAEEIYETLLKENPDNAEVLAEYGLMLSKQAGDSNMFSAAALSSKAFEYFDKAIEADSTLMKAYLYRGILGINMPKFLGKLDKGISDLEKSRKDPRLYLASVFYLGLGYEKRKELEKAANCFREIVLYKKKSEYYENSKNHLKEIEQKTLKDDVDEKTSYYQKAKEAMSSKDFNKARKMFRKADIARSQNLEFYLMYCKCIGELANKGYDAAEIQKDVQARARLAQEAKDVLNKCVELAPNSIDVRMIRAKTFVNLPFFVETLDTGIEDLKWILENTDENGIKQQAKGLFEYAKKRKNELYLTDQFVNTKDDKIRDDIIKKNIDGNTKNHIEESNRELVIEVKLGFKDYIPPQFTIWIEDTEGNYVKTIYVSDFSAKVKDKQVHLIKWAKSSEFRNIELVSGASIDAGRHIFNWDLKNADGQDVKQDEYFINMEICHWPHVKYDYIEIPVDISPKSFEMERKYGDLIYSVNIRKKTD